MQINVNTGHHIHGDAALAAEVQSVVAKALGKFEERLTRVEVYLKDEDGPAERGDAIRCLIEARPAGERPLSVRHRAPSVRLAVGGAVEKLDHRLERLFGKLGVPVFPASHDAKPEEGA